MNCPQCDYPVGKNSLYCPKCYARIAPQSRWQRLLSRFRRGPASVLHSENTVIVKTTDEQGQQREYHSLDDVPPEIRTEIERLKSEPWKETYPSISADGRRIERISKKTLSTFKVTDASGKESIYHSSDEMPPELRAVLEQAEEDQRRERAPLSIYKIVDASGKEQVYRSLDEMPPQLRAAFEQAQKENDGTKSIGDASSQPDSAG